ncbi:MAG: Ldh family oxidoreductase [Roseiflexaceae bacterium]
MPIIDHHNLRRVTQAIIEAAGTPRASALMVGDSLVEANLRGHDSHGVLRLPWYIDAVRRGVIVPDASPQVIAKHGATAQVDGALGWGQIAAHLATQTAIALATEQGLGGVTIVNGNHIGRVGEYVEIIARAGMIGIAMCNAGPAVAPYGGYQRVMGTNPLAWSAPRGPGQVPLVLDFATSSVAEGKLRVARSKGETLPPGLIVDAAGQPSRDPADFYAGGALQTFGLHKGSGISLMIELLGRGLCGIDPALPGHRGHNGTLILALHIPAFAPEQQFLDAAARLQEQVGALSPIAGVDRVLLPGEPEQLARRQRMSEGIPIPQPIWDDLVALAAEWNIVV